MNLKAFELNFFFLLKKYLKIINKPRDLIDEPRET